MVRFLLKWGACVMVSSQHARRLLGICPAHARRMVGACLAGAAAWALVGKVSFRLRRLKCGWLGASRSRRNCSTRQVHGVIRLRRPPRCSLPSGFSSRTVIIDAPGCSSNTFNAFSSVFSPIRVSGFSRSRYSPRWHPSCVFNTNARSVGNKRCPICNRLVMYVQITSFP